MSTPGGPDWQQHGRQYQRPAPYFGGYQGSSDYQGLGVYPGSSNYPDQGGPPGGPNRKRVAIIVAVVALVLLVGGGLTALLLLDSGGTAGKPVAKPVPPSSSAPATTSPLPTDVNEVKVEAITPGWQGVLSPMDGAAYDVPASWEVETPGTRTGLEDKNGEPKTIMHGVATARPGTCAKDGSGPYLTETGFMKAGSIAPSKGSRAAAMMWEEATTGQRGKDPGARQVPINGGKAKAYTSTVEVKPEADSGCPAPKVNVTTAAFEVPGATAVFVVFSPQGVPGALPPADIDKIIASLRPAR